MITQRENIKQEIFIKCTVYTFLTILGITATKQACKLNKKLHPIKVSPLAAASQVVS